MRTYVTSLNTNSRLAHIGTSYWTACGFVAASNFKVTGQLPPDRVVCPRCTKRYEPRPAGRAARAREKRLTVAELRRAEHEQMILTLLRQGRTNVAIARTLRLGMRTVVRYSGHMRAQVGGRTPFHWGYLVGRAESEATR